MLGDQVFFPPHRTHLVTSFWSMYSSSAHIYHLCVWVHVPFFYVYLVNYSLYFYFLGYTEYLIFYDVFYIVSIVILRCFMKYSHSTHIYTCICNIHVVSSKKKDGRGCMFDSLRKFIVCFTLFFCCLVFMKCFMAYFKLFS